MKSILPSVVFSIVVAPFSTPMRACRKVTYNGSGFLRYGCKPWHDTQHDDFQNNNTQDNDTKQ
jgi:hypothetical protein